MSIGSDGLLAKVKAWAETKEGKERMDVAISSAQSGNGKLASGKTVLTEAKVREISDGLVAIIEKHLPASITEGSRSVLDGLYVSSPTLENGKYTVTIKFSNLYRSSLFNDSPNAKHYDGIDNIVALLNNGVDDSHIPQTPVYGWWEGHSAATAEISRRNKRIDAADWGGDGVWVRSRTDFKGLHFLDDIKREFYATYGQQYNVELIFGADYDVT
jgi:hypothetical protein